MHHQPTVTQLKIKTRQESAEHGMLAVNKRREVQPQLNLIKIFLTRILNQLVLFYDRVPSRNDKGSWSSTIRNAINKSS